MSQSTVAVRTFTADELRTVESLADFQKLAAERGVSVANAADVLGDGFELYATNEKAKLVGVPFVIIDYRFTEGDNGEFVTVRLMTNKNDKIIINDGSTGIRDQLKALHANGVASMYVPSGLRVSEYEYEDDKGEKSKAKTFYLSSSK